MGGAFFAIAIVGVLLIITAIKGNTSTVVNQINSDIFSGSPSFLLWIGAILFLAIMGNLLKMPQATKLFIILVLAVFILRQQGLWANLETAFASNAGSQPSTTAAVGQAVTSTDQPVSIGGAVNPSQIASPFTGSLFQTPPTIAQILGQTTPSQTSTTPTTLSAPP